MLNKKDREILEKCANEVFGCSYNDLNDSEYEMLLAYARERFPEFLNHRGIM